MGKREISARWAKSCVSGDFWGFGAEFAGMLSVRRG
jgi:hypothetical protein